MKKLTTKDVEDAVTMLRCLALDSGNHWRCADGGDKHCPTCTCVNGCGHSDDWDCVASAIGAEPVVVELFFDATGAVRLVADQHEGDESDYSYSTRGLRRVGDEHCDEDLEAAQLLEDGWLPAGYALTT